MTNLAIVNLVQSITAIIAFVFLTLQICTNAKIFKYLTYFFVFIHPAFAMTNLHDLNGKELKITFHKKENEKNNKSPQRFSHA